MHHTLPIISFVSCSPTLSGFIHPHFAMFTSTDMPTKKEQHFFWITLMLTNGRLAALQNLSLTAEYLDRDLEASVCHCGSSFRGFSLEIICPVLMIECITQTTFDVT